MSYVHRWNSNYKQIVFPLRVTKFLPSIPTDCSIVSSTLLLHPQESYASWGNSLFFFSESVHFSCCSCCSGSAKATSCSKKTPRNVKRAHCIILQCLLGRFNSQSLVMFTQYLESWKFNLTKYQNCPEEGDWDSLKQKTSKTHNKQYWNAAWDPDS